MIEVGYSYTTTERSKLKGTFHIIGKDLQRSDRPFLAFCEETDSFAFFDKHGCDEWFQCGGNWRILDLESKSEAQFSLSAR